MHGAQLGARLLRGVGVVREFALRGRGEAFEETRVVHVVDEASWSPPSGLATRRGGGSDRVCEREPDP